MMFASLRYGVVASLLLLVSTPASAAKGLSADEILRRADAIIAPEEFEAELTFTTRRADGETRTFSMRMWKKGTEMMRFRFLAPADDRGTEVLRVGNNYWSYLPNLKRALKIGGKQEFHGGDFSNTDVLRVDLRQDYTPKLVSSSGEEYVLELTAKSDEVPYARVIYVVRKKDCMPLRGEYYTASGKLVRKLEMSEAKALGSHPRPTRFVMMNMVVPSRSSEMRYDSFSVRRDLDAGLFELVALGR